ncbi:unnamed protein product [Gongylonema pulchrum]|uniref:SSRP1 dimerization domain-containing protein n=1 Tax=Gongylonema pulchrum TaxID=637853 RepID=A0A3P6R9A6_9BILA|nr:unnamed protein product [Gongylonema pulchrum]
MEFEVDGKPCFEIPLSNVSNCTAGKSEAALEFHQGDGCPISLMEMRFHIPTDPDADEDVDPVEVLGFFLLGITKSELRVEDWSP